MKIAFGSRPYDGPWGGGNRFVSALGQAAEAAGHTVVYGLDDRDIDIVLIVDPRRRIPNVAFGIGAVLRYLLARNPNALVVHRINECDERKGEPFINRKLVRANYVADTTVFVGEWLTQLPVWRAHLRSPWFVIRNGSDRCLFNRKNFRQWTGQGPLHLVTHHWGYHPMKGFDVYAAIDRLLDDPKWRAKLALTYVGNLPKDFAFKNVRYVSPLNGERLADELQRHHGYLTASINEPGGNHQNEGALCGLPLLYRQSGCMPEYCAGYGVEFEGPADFPRAFDLYLEKYPSLVEKMPAYPHSSDRMTRDWIALFEDMIGERRDVVARRRIWRNPLAVVACQFV